MTPCPMCGWASGETLELVTDAYAPTVIVGDPVLSHGWLLLDDLVSRRVRIRVDEIVSVDIVHEWRDLGDPEGKGYPTRESAERDSRPVPVFAVELGLADGRAYRISEDADAKVARGIADEVWTTLVSGVNPGPWRDVIS